MEKETNQTNEHYAGFWIRFLALMLDGIVLNAVLSFIFLLFHQKYGILNTATTTNPLSLGNSLQTSLATLVQWLYSILMIKYHGATLGKMALRLKVVGADKELDWVTIIVRETIGKFISSIILGIGYLMVIWDPRKQALHDKMAGTYVVKES